MARKRLRTNMIIWLGGTLALVLFILLFAQFIVNKEHMEQGLKENAINLARYYGKRLDLNFSIAAQIPEMITTRLEADSLWNDREAIRRYLQRTLEFSPTIYGVSITFEIDGKPGSKSAFGPYYYRKDGKTIYRDLAKGGYNYWDWNWYTETKARGEAYWTDAFFDTGGGNTLMISYCHPFYRFGKFAGVTEVDISLASIVGDIDKLKVMNSGYGFMVSPSGMLLAFPDKKQIGKSNLENLVPTLSDEIDSLPKLASGDWITTADRDPLRNEDSWLIMRPVREDKRLVGAVVFVYPVREVTRSLMLLQDETFYISVAGFFILLAVIILIANSVSRPIAALSAVVGKVAGGDLEQTIAVTAKNREVQNLQTGFNKMLSDLKLFISNLRDTTAAKERIESELKIAHEIQSSMLPRTFPPFPDRNDVDIYALMDPAKEVGGDFYDFFLIGETKLCFLVGDVSGKGVPAALFMMINKVLLKNEGIGGNSPDRILTRVNAIVSEDNEELMFVTIFCAIIDLRTGDVQYSNAGHNPPLIGTADGRFEYIKPDKNFVLGVKPGLNYTLNTTKLNHGETFFLYTDGVTEALNHEQKLYTEERLKQSLNCATDSTTMGLIKKVRKDITEFASGAEQSDDITMLAVKFLNKES